MKTLIAFGLLVAFAVADPQIYTYSTHPGLSHVNTIPVGPHVSNHHVVSPVVARSGLVVPSHVSHVVNPVATVVYPSQDTSRGIPQPVQDTPEVKHAKAIFAQNYHNAAVLAALSPESRKKRDVISSVGYPVSAVSPVAYSTYHAAGYPVVSGVYSSPYVVHHYG